MTTAALIVARLSSTRLPAKNLMPFAGKPMIQHLIDRLRKSDRIDDVVIATSVEESDDPLQAFAERQNVMCHRGPLDNVMERICGAARAAKADTIIEILGDNPLIHADLVDEVLTKYETENLDYAANISGDYAVRPADLALFAIGIRVQVYARSTAEKYVDYPDVKGHPSSYIFDNPDVFKCGYIEATGKWSSLHKPDVNLAVNYRGNFDAVAQIFSDLCRVNPEFALPEVGDYLDRHPDLYKLLGPQ